MRNPAFFVDDLQTDSAVRNGDPIDPPNWSILAQKMSARVLRLM